MKNWKILLVSYLTLGTVLNTSDKIQAQTITFDPGNVGSTFTDTVISFNDLNNTNLNGQGLNIDFVFSDMKHLVPKFAITPPAVNFYTIELALLHNAGLPGIPNPISGFLSDEEGNSIATPNVANILQTPNVLTYRLLFDQSVDDLIHHGIHFDINLPNTNNGMIIGAELDLIINSPGAVIEVGEWEEDPEIPGPPEVTEFSSNFNFFTLIIIGIISKVRKKLSFQDISESFFK